jgi:hypothetical protein
MPLYRNYLLGFVLKENLMLKSSALLKWVFGILLGLGGGTVMMMYYTPGYSSSIWKYPQSIYDSYFKKPKAPEIVDQKKEGNCGARIWWVDNALNEDGVRLYRHVIGEPNFVAIKVTGPHAGIPGSFDDPNLPMGTYEYRVGAFNEYGTSYSNISEQIVIDDEVCGDEPLLVKPLNPVITAVERVKGEACTIRVYFNDNSTDEDGIRIYRSEWNDPDVLLADLPPNNTPTGFYDDVDVPPGHYTYQVSAYNANGEAFSQLSDEFEITEEACGSSNVLTIVTNPPLVISTFTPTPVASAQACIWKAAINVFVRKGPGASLYPELTAVEAGAELPVVGQSEDGQFWAVELNGDVIGYVPKAEKFGSTSGDCDVPTLDDPAPPPTPVPTRVKAQCQDEIDNDGDGAVDMRDRDCSAPNDNSE